MKYLTEELHKFYHKNGNKVVFSNGMDLNKLSLEIWTKLGFKGMDSSILSKIINGKRLFTRNQLYTFCKILHLTKVERYSLENAVGKDLLVKHIGKALPISDHMELVADAYIKNLILNQIQRLRKHGNMQEAMQVASFFEKFFVLHLKLKKQIFLY